MSKGGGQVRARSGHRHGSGNLAALSTVLLKAGRVSKRPVLLCVLLSDSHRLRGLLSKGPWRLFYPTPHFMDKETRWAQGHIAGHWKSWPHPRCCDS